ncbi:MAG: hypothetical protein DKM23_06190 [Candidatus Melainabacteria bacterium]|nr:MAG: hypothetical protein DKM23_06190 [Candidatus Melainabacteria bacterium]
MNKKQEIKNRIDLINKGEVLEGYKKRFGYIVPNDWDIVPIKKVVTQVHRSVDKPNEPYYRLSVRSHAKGTFHSFVEDPETVAMEELYKVKENDLIVNITFAWEHAIAIVKKEDDGLLVSHRFPTYEFNNNVCVKFYENIIKFPRIKKMLGDMSPGGAGRNRVLNQTDFYNKLYVPYTSKKEQEKIAEILSCCDKVIELKENLLIEKKQEKKYLMQKLYTPKIDWIKCSVSKFGNVVTGNTPSTDIKEYYGTEYPWITPSDINSNKYIYKGDRNLSNIGITKARLLPKDSVLVTCIASIGKNAILKVKGSCNQQINAIIPNDSMSADFIYYLIENNTLLLKKYAGTSATSIINKDTFENLVFKIPNNKQEQIKIAEILSQFDKEIELLEQELEQYKQLKKSLSQLLLTGIVRVNEV